MNFGTVPAKWKQSGFGSHVSHGTPAGVHEHGERTRFETWHRLRAITICLLAGKEGMY
jgi:hypothetical protein